jgi:acid stress-induced BolA-like protein IbaG/YrbA
MSGVMFWRANEFENNHLFPLLGYLILTRVAQCHVIMRRFSIDQSVRVKMDVEEIRRLLEAGLGECEVAIQAEGNKLGLMLVSGVFSGLSRVKRQQLVYSFLNEKINSGEIHAVSMKCQTPEETNI